MGYRTVSQIILIVLSVVIMATYISPRLGEVQKSQDEIARYQEAVDRAVQFNELLQSLLQRGSEFTQSDIKALERYVPPTIDRVAIAKDVNAIAITSGARLNALAFVGEEAQLANEFEDDSGAFTQTGLVRDTFTVSVQGEYEELKSFLEIAENNAYPLEVVRIDLSGEAENDEYAFTITYETYALHEQS